MSEESFVKISKGFTSFVGPDATALFGAIMLRHAIELYLTTGVRVNRSFTPMTMRNTAARLFGKPAYKQSRAGLAQARDDLDVWIVNMKMALRVETDFTE